MRRWVKDGWSLRYIFNYALALHGSYLNNKSARCRRTRMSGRRSNAFFGGSATVWSCGRSNTRSA